jgi:hypothetical protein
LALSSDQRAAARGFGLRGAALAERTNSIERAKSAAALMVIVLI